MKKLIVLTLALMSLFKIFPAAKEVICEDLGYRHHLTRTDIELLNRTHHRSNYKDAYLRELQDHERYLQDLTREQDCYR